MARTAEFYIDRALEALNAGFTSKSAKQNAIDNLNRAYDVTAKLDGPTSIMEHLLQEDERGTPEWSALYYGVPDLHNWKPRHSAQYAKFAANVAAIERLVEMREAIKAAPVTPPVRNTHAAEIKAVTESIIDIMKRRGEQYNRALDLGERFGGLPVRANVHLCVNEHGTHYIRAFYYLDGEFTPLQVILAAAQELKRRTDAA